MKASIIKTPPRRVAFVRHVGPYLDCEPAWTELCSLAASQGILDSNSVFIGLSHDDPAVTEPERLRYDACLLTDLELTPSGKIGLMVIPGGEYASTVHVGPLAGIARRFDRLCAEWVPAQNRELGLGACVEVYLDDPGSTPSDKLHVKLEAPLA